MKYICNLVNTEDNKRKNDAKINKLEVNIADDIDRECESFSVNLIFKYN